MESNIISYITLKWLRYDYIFNRLTFNCNQIPLQSNLPCPGRRRLVCALLTRGQQDGGDSECQRQRVFLRVDQEQVRPQERASVREQTGPAFVSSQVRRSRRAPAG